MINRRLAAAGLLLLCSKAQATWSIILVDVRTGEIAVGSATCLTGFDLRANTPVLIPLVGAATAQSQVDSTGQNRVFIRDGLANGISPQQILAGLVTFDGGAHEGRQYGMADATGRTLTFSGQENGPWAGGQTGRVGDVAYAIQGNVLTGPCVVGAAVQSAIATPGDLSTKLMAAMEAAKAAGGDGRCSCTGQGPDACGCPPGAFLKSSHIAYMMTARAGDTEGCVGLYRLTSSVPAVTTADVDGDQRVDLVAGAGNGANFVIFRNTTPVGGAAPTFAPAVVSPLNGTAAPRAPVVRDFDGDGVADIGAFMSSGSQFVIARGLGNGLFSRGTFFPSGGSPSAMVVGDFDNQHGPDLAFTIAATSSVAVALNNGAGGFTLVGPTPLGGTAIGNTIMAAGDLDGDGTVDLAVGLRSSPFGVALLRGQGDGTFVRAATLSLTGPPSSVVVRDLNRDGAADVAVTLDSNRLVRTFLRTSAAPLTYVTAALPLATGLTPTRMHAADLTGDGAPELVVTASNSMVVLRNDGGGAFTINQTIASPTGTNFESTPGDFDGDGLADVAAAGGSVMLTFPNRNGSLTMPGGCATGAYYMNLNVANQTAGNPDPVITLRTQFNSFRLSQRGKVDAVLTTVDAPGPCVMSSGQSVQIVIGPRDLDGTPVTTPLAVRAEHTRDSAGLSSIGPAVVRPDGRIAVMVSLPDAGAGLDTLRIELDDGVRTVTLMPTVSVRIALDTDVDDDGATTPTDLAAYIAAYFASEAGADVDGNGVLSPDDLDDFITAFFAAC